MEFTFLEIVLILYIIYTSKNVSRFIKEILDAFVSTFIIILRFAGPSILAFMASIYIMKYVEVAENIEHAIIFTEAIIVCSITGYLYKKHLKKKAEKYLSEEEQII